MGSRQPRITPQFEHDLIRDPRLGYEALDEQSLVRCVEHGSPTPLERWHCHDEYELQLIVGARGRAFVGDYVGPFEPGHLVLTGPRLPHNWISTDLPPDGLAVRSLVLQFHDRPLRQAMQAIRELAEVQPLLDRSLRGVEFFGLGEAVRERFHRIRTSRGLARFIEFTGLLSELARCDDYRLLSSHPPMAPGRDADLATINTIIEFINENHAEPISVAQAAARVHMSESSFSRFFSKVADSSFPAFVNRVRVHKACQLLARSDDAISTICYAVGFNNVANFNRRFLEAKGMTPREYRRSAAVEPQHRA